MPQDNFYREWESISNNLGRASYYAFTAITSLLMTIRLPKNLTNVITTEKRVRSEVIRSSFIWGYSKINSIKINEMLNRMFIFSCSYLPLINNRVDMIISFNLPITEKTVQKAVCDIGQISEAFHITCSDEQVKGT